MQLGIVVVLTVACALAGAEEPALQARQFALIDGARASVTNAAQKIDGMVHTMRSDPGRAGAATATALITGLDSQIDTAIATVSNALSPLTFGVSKAIGNTILGPFFQSVTDGVEVLLGNAVGGVFDLAMSPVTGSLQKNIERLIRESEQYNINTSRLQSLNSQLSEAISKSKSTPAHGHLHRRDVIELEARQFALLDGARESVTNAAQKIDGMVHTIRTDPDRAGAATATALITGLDSQIDTAIATVSNALSPLTFGVSKAVGNAILGPFVQSVTDGAEVLLGNVVGGVFDLATSPLTGSLQRNIGKLIKEADQYNINTSRLQILNSRLEMHAARGGH
ncbi:hypothetical protein TRVA0_013S02806 [Trichomonascus vanleenenianus]|uniref:uncharacterized protein n=1 Tax=Trichomonascus vanleenenianus TaxID=2268995 RepID=UPI003ECA134D